MRGFRTIGRGVHNFLDASPCLAWAATDAHGCTTAASNLLSRPLVSLARLYAALGVYIVAGRCARYHAARDLPRSAFTTSTEPRSPHGGSMGHRMPNHSRYPPPPLPFTDYPPSPTSTVND